jgi:hypothetical protein
MCCFSRPVESVTQTSIFGRLKDHATQFLVYQMHFKSREPNAMILPIPTAENPSEESVRFINLEAYPWFFVDLARGFPSLNPPPTMSRGVDSGSKSKLQVQKVGAFIASVVPRAEDFRRLDSQFSIAPETWAKLPVYSDYSFVVFQLQELEGKPHPMAFEFQTRYSERVFFPTVHIHDGEVHDAEDFDHQLYLQQPTWDKLVGDYTHEPDEATQWVRSKGVAEKTVKIEKTEGIVVADQLVHRRTIQGQHRNEDVVANVSLQDRSDKSSFGSFGGVSATWLSTILGAGALAWIFNRRHELRSIPRSAK